MDGREDGCVVWGYSVSLPGLDRAESLEGRMVLVFEIRGTECLPTAPAT